MDVGSESATRESVQDNETMNYEKSGNDNENTIGVNGSDDGDDKTKDDTTTEPEISPTPTGSVGVSSGTKKGYGLKKWRRIKRESVKDGSGSVDSGKILKRGLSNSLANPTRSQGLSTHSRQISGGSLSSTSAIVRDFGGKANGLSLHGSSLDSKLVIGPNFAVGADSENSEDQSSMSSTAASASVLRNGAPAMAVMGLSGKNMVNGVQRGQQGKTRVKNTKKPRGEQEKLEKEYSLSSMESDSRSSNFVFVQGTNSVTSNGRHSGKPANHAGENSDDEAQDGEQHFSNEFQAGNSKEHGVKIKDLSHEYLADVVNYTLSTDLDPLVESIFKLQSAQEALEKEVQKLREIGNESQGSTIMLDFTSTDQEIHGASSSGLLNSGENREIFPQFLEKQVNTLKQNVDVSERKLEEANAALKAEEVKSNESPKEDMLSTIDSQPRNYEEFEAEIEGLFKQKLEAEFEYLAISRAVLKLKTDVVDQVALFDENKTMLNELRVAENKAEMLEGQAKKLETYVEDIVETGQVSKLEKGIRKVTLCLFLQLMLLFIVFASFLLHSSPNYAGLVPT